MKISLVPSLSTLLVLVVVMMMGMVLLLLLLLYQQLLPHEALGGDLLHLPFSQSPVRNDPPMGNIILL